VVAALLAEQKTAELGDELLRFVQLGRDPSVRPGACTVTRATALRALAGRPPSADGRDQPRLERPRSGRGQAALSTAETTTVAGRPR